MRGPASFPVRQALPERSQTSGTGLTNYRAPHLLSGARVRVSACEGVSGGAVGVLHVTMTMGVCVGDWLQVPVSPLICQRLWLLAPGPPRHPEPPLKTRGSTRTTHPAPQPLTFFVPHHHPLFGQIRAQNPTCFPVPRSDVCSSQTPCSFLSLT